MVPVRWEWRIMLRYTEKPRLVRFDDVLLVVRELHKLGISGRNLYARVAEIGPVDLDILNEVLRAEQLPA
jgi:hypothetical protein